MVQNNWNVLSPSSKVYYDKTPMNTAGSGNILTDKSGIERIKHCLSYQVKYY